MSINKIKSGAYIVCLVFILVLSAQAFAQDEPENATSSLYTLSLEENKHIKLVPKIHLIPPGSSKVYEEVHLKALSDIQPPSIQESAHKDVQFFKNKVQEDTQTTMQVLDAVFDVYKDMMGNYYTDPVVFFLRPLKQ